MRTRESAFSWCLKKSSMVHDDRSLLDALSLSVNDRVDSHLTIPFVARVKFTELL